jgi:hypothetical protein
MVASERKLDMPAKLTFEGLIKAAWDVIEYDFDKTAFLAWREAAAECLSEILGPDHYYTKHFGHNVLRPDEMGVLSGTGILIAAKEQMTNGDSRLCPALGI